MSRQTTFLLSFVVVTALILSACQPTSQSTAPAATATPTVASATPATSPATSPQGMTQTQTVPTSKKVSFATNYQSPAQLEQVAFTLTVDANGVITDAHTDVLAVHPTSKMRQTSFAEALPAALKGKKLAELSQVDRVGGSSLTTGAFNKALAELKAQL